MSVDTAIFKVGAIEKSTKSITVKELIKRYDAGKLRFDLAIQRNEVWDPHRKSLFIHSILMGFPFPPCYAQDSGDGILWMLDGKQRMTTVIRFVKGEFALDEDTPGVPFENVDGEIDYYSLDGRYFDDLPQDFKDAILSAQFLIYCLKGLNEDLRDEMFLRLNNGLALTPIELTRVAASSKIMSFINEIADSHFFTNSISITEKARNRFVDQEIILQIAMLISANGPTSLQSRDIRAFAEHLKQHGLSEELKDTMRNVTEYLGKAYETKASYLKKVHIPALFMVAREAMKMGIEPNKFALWAHGFFANLKKPAPGSLYAQYAYATKSGSAKRENVEKRLNTMLQHFYENINSVVDANENSAGQETDVETEAETETIPA